MRRTLAYFAFGSIAAGTVFGLGFPINFGGGATVEDEERRRKLGPSKVFDLGNISGTLTYHDRRGPTIVFVHGRSAGWSEALPLAQKFYAEGYAVVLWARAGRTIQYGDEGIHDVLRVVEHVRTDPAVDTETIFVFGLSLGAAMALGAAAEDRNGYISGVIADSPYSNLKSAALRYLTAFGWIPKPLAWPAAFVMFQVAEAAHHIHFKRCNPIDWAKRIRCPVLLTHGRNDGRVLPEHSVCLFGAVTSPKELWLVDGAGHTEAFVSHPHEYVRRVNQFAGNVVDRIIRHRNSNKGL
jgi:dipeptidyl aminopeptidase/acylaminoacyl peptidase